MLGPDANDELIRGLLRQLNELKRQVTDLASLESGGPLTWVPAIQGSGSNPTVTYTTQLGTYSRTGSAVVYAVHIVINTYSGGSGNIRVTLPVAVGARTCPTALYASGLNFSGTPVGTLFVPQPTVAYAHIVSVNDNAAPTTEAVGILAAGDTLIASGIYFT